MRYELYSYMSIHNIYYNYYKLFHNLYIKNCYITNLSNGYIYLTSEKDFNFNLNYELYFFKIWYLYICLYKIRISL